MPFSTGPVLLTGIAAITLTHPGTAGVYNVETEVVAALGSASFAGLVIILNVSGTIQATGVSLIDATGVHNDAVLTIDLSSATLRGRAGVGGKGADIQSDFENETSTWFFSTEDGSPGTDGKDVILLGCDTTIKGSGSIVAGFGGGGGGGANRNASNGNVTGGSGGGGGVASGAGGAAGNATTLNGATTTNGNAGSAATTTTKGAGGAAASGGGVTGGAGGDGGDGSNAPQAGASTGISNGGAAGANGVTVKKNGFTLTKEGSVTYVGSEGA